MRVVHGLGLAGLCAAVLALSGCAAIFGGGSSLVLPVDMPPDFRLTLTVVEAMKPPVDYDLVIERGGKLQYDVTIRAPARRSLKGDTSLTEKQVRGLWDAVRKSQFDQLAAEYAPGSGAESTAVGLRTFYVYADGRDKRIEAQRVAVPALDGLQKAILAATPKHALEGGDDPNAPRTRPETIVADTASRRFHRPDCELCKTIPSVKRRTFATEFEALDFGFDPCGTCRPMSSE